MANSLETKYLIIGNSAGGIGAVEAIRETDKTGAITIVSDEPYPAYSRPQIAYHLSEGKPLEKMLYRKPDFYDEYEVNVILGVAVESLDLENQSVLLADEREIKWEKLLIATGGIPITPPTEGLPPEKTLTFTTLDDAKKIDQALRASKSDPVRVVVIGGGLIGASVTEALVGRNANVSIIEMKDRILNVMLDEEGSAIAAAALEKAGVNIFTEHTVSRVDNDSQGQIIGVTLDDGSTIDCDLVVVAIGVRPRSELVRDTDIKVNRGILVDSHMETSHADVYACGDVAEAYDFVYGENRLSPIWPNAYIGGRVAGQNMAGTETEYVGGTAMNSTKYFGLAISSAGLVVPPDSSYEVIESRYDGSYKKVVIKDGIVVGLIFSGDIEKSGIVYNLMKKKVNVNDFKDDLVSYDFGLISIPEELWRPSLEMPRSRETA